MKSIIDKIYDRTFASEQEITKQLVEYYESNPEELDLIIEEEEFHSGFLKFFFAFGLALTLTSRVLIVSLKGYINEFIEVVILDVISEIGIVIFGGTLVAYFIEFLKHKQFKKNQDFRNAINRKIEECKNGQS
ncbi:MAG: hypothetical protein AAFP08_01845 [Bacteroidota bacterium]